MRVQQNYLYITPLWSMDLQAIDVMLMFLLSHWSLLKLNGQKVDKYYQN